MSVYFIIYLLFHVLTYITLNLDMINKFIHIDQVRSLAALPGGSLVSGLYNGQISIWTV